TFSLLYLGRFARLNARTEDPAVDGRTLVRFVGLMVAIQVLLRWAWPGQQTLVWDWANFAYYSAFFIGGFYVGRFPSVANLVDEHRVVMGRIGLLASVAMVPFFLRLVVVEDVGDWPGYLAHTSLSALAGVGMVIGIAGWARHRFAGDGRLHRWTRDRAFGIYLLHQPCVVAAAALVVGTSWPIAAKFSLTLLAATALTIASNEVLSRIDVLAPAFGRDRRTRAPATRWPGTSVPQ
ncbi:MAG TPA: hypothetical protein VMZ22_02525, partial [Acidimicrobiales bacterium]|nr:hypothetical protein [Acidimicrobiales bacterium]